MPSRSTCFTVISHFFVSRRRSTLSSDILKGKKLLQSLSVITTREKTLLLCWWETHSHPGCCYHKMLPKILLHAQHIAGAQKFVHDIFFAITKSAKVLNVDLNVLCVLQKSAFINQDIIFCYALWCNWSVSHRPHADVNVHWLCVCEYTTCHQDPHSNQ